MTSRKNNVKRPRNNQPYFERIKHEFDREVVENDVLHNLARGLYMLCVLKHVEFDSVQ